MRTRPGVIEIEEEMSHAAADVIFRTLFSIPIEHEVAAKVFAQFRDYQRTQPILNLAAFIPGPRWMPRFFKRATKDTAADIRRLITDLTERRMFEIDAGTAPDDLATKIMTTADPETGDIKNTWTYLGDPLHLANPDEAYAENFLYMLTERVPDPTLANIFDICLI